MLPSGPWAWKIVAFVVLAAPPQDRELVVQSMFHEGQPVVLDFEQAAAREAVFRFGPWKFGAKVKTLKKGIAEKPHDTRLNLYIVVPGAVHRSEHEQWDNTVVVNALPSPGSAAEFDVYWALALDPRLSADIRSERRLIAAAQSRFLPNDLYEFSDAPGANMLKELLNYDSLFSLSRHRRPDGTLPRLLIVPAGFALRARAETSRILPKSP